MRTERAI